MTIARAGLRAGAGAHRAAGRTSGPGRNHVPHRPRRPDRARRRGARGGPAAHPAGGRAPVQLPSGGRGHRHGAPGQPPRRRRRPSSGASASRCRSAPTCAPGGFAPRRLRPGVIATVTAVPEAARPLRRRRRLGDGGRRPTTACAGRRCAPAGAPAAGSSWCRARPPAPASRSAARPSCSTATWSADRGGHGARGRGRSGEAHVDERPHLRLGDPQPDPGRRCCSSA